MKLFQTIMMFGDLSTQELSKALGKPQTPKSIWQKPFDYIPGHCERIVENGPKASHRDLNEYFLDYQYMEVQHDLFKFILPIAVGAWGKHLLDDQPSWSFPDMWQAFDRRPLSPDYLTEKQYSALSNFFAQTILLRMQKENSLSFQGSNASPYEWMSILTSLIFLFPIAEKIWKTWWTLEEEWQAICGLQWWSGFMYHRNESPIFGPHTPKHGGGNCTPYETEHLAYRPADRKNVSFLKQELNLKMAQSQILRCCDRLESIALRQVGNQIHTELIDQSIVLEERLTKFIRLLEMENAHEVVWWNDIPE